MKNTPLNDGRPAFALEPYADPAPLPSNMRLANEKELAGHTIAALITDPSGPATRRSVLDFVVIVTETRCWLVLEAENDDERAVIGIRSGRYEAAAQLSDYLSAHDMLVAGLIAQSEYSAACMAENEKTKELQRLNNAERAARLRKELAMLEVAASK